MSAQSTYSRVPAAAYPGQLFGDGHDIETLLVETAAGIAPGAVVSVGTADDQCALGGSAPIGIVARRLDVENNASDVLLYEQYAPATVVKRGKVHVAFAAAVTRGDLLKYTTATGVVGSGVAGAGELQLRGQVLETIGAAGVALVDLEPQYSVGVLTDATIDGTGVTGDPLAVA